MNIKSVRKEFPLLKNKNLIYFDNSASTLKPIMVAKRMKHYLLHTPTNVGRGLYKLELNVTNKVENARKQIANFIGANADEIVFTKNTSESINLVALSYALNNLKPEDEVIISTLEHHSNYLPWQEVCNKTKAKLVFVPLTKDHKITTANFKKVLSHKTKIVALTYVSNVFGYITPIKEITRLAHSVGAVVVVDGAQAVSHFEIDVKKLKCDFFAFSGYKVFGPTGIGILYGKKELLNTMQPVMFGGGMILDITENKNEYMPVPHKFESGTLPVAEILGLEEAIKFVKNIGFDEIAKQDTILKNYLTDELQKIKEVELYNKNPDLPIVAFNIKNVHSHDVATLYDEFGVCIRAGHHCALPLMNYINQPSTIRVSLAFYNTTKEIDKFILATKKIINFFKNLGENNERN